MVVGSCTVTVRCEMFNQQYIFEHFNREQHNAFLSDVSVILIGNTSATHPLRQEHY